MPPSNRRLRKTTTSKLPQNCYILQIPGHQIRSVGEGSISLQHRFTIFPRDGSSDYRTLPNVTFTVCHRHQFYDLATLPTQVNGVTKSSDNLYAPCIITQPEFIYIYQAHVFKTLTQFNPRTDHFSNNVTMNSNSEPTKYNLP
jgi:hypothetical protein